MNNMAKNLLLWLLIAAVLLSVFNNFNLRSSTEQVGYSEFIREVQTDRLSKVLVDGLTITAQRKDGSSFETIRPMVEDPKLMDDLLAHNVTVEGKQPEQQSVWTQLLIAELPDPAHYCGVHVLHAADARRRRWPRRPDELWQE